MSLARSVKIRGDPLEAARNAKCARGPLDPVDGLVIRARHEAGALVPEVALDHVVARVHELGHVRRGVPRLSRRDAPLIENGHAFPRLGEEPRGDQARQAAADDGDIDLDVAREGRVGGLGRRRRPE